MEKSCLTCKYEPDWGKLECYGEVERRYGECKYKVELPTLPQWFVYQLLNLIVRYGDDSGIYFNCKTWESKQH